MQPPQTFVLMCLLAPRILRSREDAGLVGPMQPPYAKIRFQRWFVMPGVAPRPKTFSDVRILFGARRLRSMIRIASVGLKRRVELADLGADKDPKKRTAFRPLALGRSTCFC